MATGMEINEKENNLFERRPSFLGVNHLWDKGVKEIPSEYVFPISDRGHVGKKLELPVIDLSDLHTLSRANVVRSLGQACQEYGFFQVPKLSLDLVFKSTLTSSLGFSLRSPIMASLKRLFVV